MLGKKKKPKDFSVSAVVVSLGSKIVLWLTLFFLWLGKKKTRNRCFLFLFFFLFCFFFGHFWSCFGGVILWFRYKVTCFFVFFKNKKSHGLTCQVKSGRRRATSQRQDWCHQPLCFHLVNLLVSRAPTSEAGIAAEFAWQLATSTACHAWMSKKINKRESVGQTH